MFVTLGHILYGTAAYQHGNVRLIARASGEQGLGAVYSFTVGGASPVVVVALTSAGAGSVQVTAPSSTTERQLVQALRAAPGFFQLFSLDLTGDGSPLVSTVTQLPVIDGFLQHLQTRLPLPGPDAGVGLPWADRDTIATGSPVGLLWPSTGKFIRFNPEYDGTNEYEGVVVLAIGLALRVNSFHRQNSIIEYYRRKLAMAATIFKHDGLMGLGPIEWGFTNTEKDEVAGDTTGTPLDHARCRVVFSCTIKWSEPSRDEEDLIYAALQPPHIGLWREPLTDPLGPGGGEDLDTILTVS